MSFECGQQRVMRLGWERPRSLALWRVLTNRMREFFTYGSVGGAGGNPGSYPAIHLHRRGGQGSSKVCLLRRPDSRQGNQNGERGYVKSIGQGDPHPAGE